MTASERVAIWRINNPEKLRQQRSKYRETHKDYYREYREKNKSRIKELRQLRDKTSEITPSERVLMWRKNNPEKDREQRARYREKHREHRKAYARVYNKNNKLRKKAYSRMRYLRDKEKIRAATRAWQTKYPEKYAAIKKAAGAYTMRRFYSDPNFRLATTIRNRIKDFITSGKGNRRCKSLDLLGAEIIEVRLHLESKFKPGMTWENYGYKGWHIDHILPCSAFDLTNPEDQKECFSYTNLQPLWWWENLSKNNTI
jgi:hypothetical protein